MAHRILMLCERGGLADAIAGQLVDSGFVIDSVADPDAAAGRLQADPRPVVVVASSARLAVDHCSAIRWASTLPILAIVPGASERGVVDLIDAGADSVLTSGLDRRELAARVRAACSPRRRKPGRCQRMTANRVGAISIDERRHTVAAGGRQLSFTPTEFRLLAALVRRKGHIASTHELITEVWGPDSRDAKRKLRLYVGYLRRKLGAAESSGAVLVNQRGVGYRLADAAAS